MFSSNGCPPSFVIFFLGGEGGLHGSFVGSFGRYLISSRYPWTD